MRSENTPRPIPAGLPRIDQPVAGWYAVRIVKNGPKIAARLWFGPPNDPLPPHEPLDRSPRWQAERGGQECLLEDLWPFCHASPITEAEYRHLLAVQAWATEHSPHAPEATPGKAIDMLTAPCPW